MQGSGFERHLEVDHNPWYYTCFMMRMAEVMALCGHTIEGARARRMALYKLKVSLKIVIGS